MSNDRLYFKIAFLLCRRDFLLQQIRETSPRIAPAHYRRLLSQLEEVNYELLGASRVPRPTERLGSGVPPKYWRVLGWLVLGLSCLVGGVYVLN